MPITWIGACLPLLWYQVSHSTRGSLEGGGASYHKEGKMSPEGAAEMAQGLKILVVLAEEPGSLQSTHIVVANHC